MKNEKFPELITNRMKLRQMSTSDIEDIFVLRSHPTMLKYLNRSAPDMDKVKQWIKTTLNSEKNNELVSWLPCDLNTGEVVGHICLWNIEHENYRAEIGYSILPQHHGKGYMKEIMQAVLEHAFENMKLHTISGYVNPKNKASVRVLEGNGFEKEGLLKECTHYKGEFYDLAIYRLTSQIPHDYNG